MCERLLATKLCVRVTKRRQGPAQCHKPHASWAKCAWAPRESAQCHKCVTSATQSGGPRCQVPRLPRKVGVHVAKRHACHAKCKPLGKCHSCHAKSSGVTADQARHRRPSTPPEPRVAKCQACNAKSSSVALRKIVCEQVVRVRVRVRVHVRV